MSTLLNLLAKALGEEPATTSQGLTISLSVGIVLGVCCLGLLAFVVICGIRSNCKKEEDEDEDEKADKAAKKLADAKAAKSVELQAFRAKAIEIERTRAAASAARLSAAPAPEPGVPELTPIAVPVDSSV